VLLTLPYPHSSKTADIAAKPLTIRKLVEFGVLETIVGGFRLTRFGRLVQEEALRLAGPARGQYATVVRAPGFDAHPAA
jgi:hypothetical protein